MFKGLIISAASTVFLSVSAFAQSSSNFLSGFDMASTSAGSIKLPDVDFRSDWTMLGSWSINGEAGADDMHVVYTQPGVSKEYQKTGQFPDGTILVKELLSAKTEALTTGTVSYADNINGWFVMIKDSTDRYPNNPLWGDGWGWGYFEADDPKTLVTNNYKLECRSCHVPARSTDWVYTRAYPVLRTD